MNEATPEQLQEMEMIKKMIMKKLLSKEALERFGRIRLVKPELATQLELYLVQLYQVGKLKMQISDEELKLILQSLSKKENFKIIK